MDREAIEEAIEVLEDASAEMLTETGNENYYGEAIAILRQALETEQKTTVSPGKGTGFRAMDEGYYCVVCGKYIEAVDDVIVHDDIPHPADMAFDEEENPQ